jgi:glycosyltransferase involved in cell wall biosynthesis
MEVRELIDQLGLPGCVELFGECVDVLPLLRAAHVGVLTSISEGLPVSVLEYMAAGLPVVLTDVGQAPAIVRQADAGTIVPPRDPEKLAEAVRLILTDPQRARQMGRNGRQFVACHYTVERMAHEVSSLYRMLLAERKR